MARNRVGPLYIYGPIGSGKTTILRRLYETLRDDPLYNVSMLISPNIKTSNAFLRIVMEEFGVKTERAYDRSLRSFEQFLVQQYEAGKVPLLLIDEAQNMTRDTLRLIHYLLNFETTKAKLLQIVLVGQEDLATKIMRYRELASRMFPIAMNAMSPDELGKMIEFRLMVAGATAVPFSPDAYGTIFEYSKGLPRDAVRLCDEALRHMVATGQTVISSDDIHVVAKELNLTT
jgi:general secretion pathway protein A